MTMQTRTFRFMLSAVLMTCCHNLFAQGASAIEESVNSPDRREQDLARDAGRRPAEVLEFFEISPGMTVLDLFSGGGYYSEIVSRVVGRDGRVLSHNNEAYLAFVNAEVTARYGDDRLPNVTQISAEANDLALGPASIDVVLAILTWHDFYYVDSANNWPKVDAAQLVDTLCSAVKPGGILGVIDHVATTGSDPWDSGQKLHRIDPARIKADLADSCFEFDGASDLLRNDADDHLKSMEDPSVRGKTDRVVYRFSRR